MTAAQAAEHFVYSLLAATATMFAIIVGSYIAQENEAAAAVPTVCVASWDCQTNQRVAPAPDRQQTAKLNEYNTYRNAHLTHARSLP